MAVERLHQWYEVLPEFGHLQCCYCYCSTLMTRAMHFHMVSDLCKVECLGCTAILSLLLQSFTVLPVLPHDIWAGSSCKSE
eukprot:240626-Prorocentrum_lima.AAC.1